MRRVRLGFGAVALSAALGVLSASAAPARAAEEGKGAPQHVDYAAVPLPIVQDGRLVNYVFVVLRLTPQPGADPTKLKEREPYVVDRLVRVGHKQPFVRPGDLTHVDERRLLALVAAEAPRLIGPRLVAKVEIASETPQHRTGLPRPAPARAIVP